MAFLISFRTAQFDPSKERPNPINPIAGESVLFWIREKALHGSFSSTEPDTEDWGWYIDVEAPEASYLVGACGQFELEEVTDGVNLEWLLQVHKRRSVVEKLLGRNKMQADDPLVATIVGALKNDAAFTDVEVESDA